MKCGRLEEDPYLYQGRGFTRGGGTNGKGGQQVVGGSEWVSRCGGGRYKRSVSGRVIVYWAVVSSLFEKYPKDYTQYSKHGESLKSRIQLCC